MRVDLLLLHWPSREVPLAETIARPQPGACRRQGQAYRHQQLHHGDDRRGGAAQRRPLATDQVEYHPLLSQRAVLASCRQHGMALTAYCPLARGRVFANQTLRRIGERHGRGAGQIALRWLVQQPDVVAIPRSSSEAHARSNFAIFDFALGEAEMEEIAALGIPAGRVVNVASVAPAWDAE